MDKGGEALRLEIEALRGEVAALREENDLLRAAFEAMSEGATLTDADGRVMLINPAARRITGASTDASTQAVFKGHEFFLPDMVTPCPLEQIPGLRALRGERIDYEEIYVRAPGEAEGAWVIGSASPILDDTGAVRAVVCLFRDATQQKELERDLAARNAALRASEAEREALIQRLQGAVRDLSTPILEVWGGVLALPIIGVVDARRGAEILERLLDAVVERGAGFVIVDLTGVDMIDTETAGQFLRLAQALSLVGARCVLTGIRPSVAQALIGLGADLRGLTMLRTLKYGLLYCLRHLRGQASAAPAAGERT